MKNTPWRHLRQEKRRQEAQARQEAYDALSVDEKVELVKSRRGESVKEMKRLGVG